MFKRTILFLFFIVGFMFLLSCAKEPDLIPPDETPNNEPQLYYYSKRNGVNNIYKSDLDGNEKVIIVDNDHNDWWIRVSPDKKTILWYKSPINVPSNKQSNNYENAELWMAGINGENPHKVIDLEDKNWSAQGVADWSPDGTELVMAVTDTSKHWQIYITKADGTNPKKISRRNSLYADPSWSPDGQKIVYTAFPKEYNGLSFFELEIHVMNRDGSNEIQLTDDEFRDHDPYWSPDGKEIAFESQWNLLHCFVGKWAIRKYNFDTGLTSDLVMDDDANGLPRWTKNSEHIYFAKLKCATNTQLMRINRNGDNLELVLKNDNFPYYDCDIVE